VQIIAKLIIINGKYGNRKRKIKKLFEKTIPDAICKDLNSISYKAFVEYCNATLRNLKNSGEKGKIDKLICIPLCYSIVYMYGMLFVS
jgi:hypothetical protein